MERVALSGSCVQQNPTVEVALAVKKTLFERWGIKPDEIEAIVESNPSLRGILLGYIAELKARGFFTGPAFSDHRKDDDHDRTKKGDLVVTYKGVEIRVEVKSLQTNSVKNLGNDKWVGTFQVDASDRRPIKLPNGHTVETTCLQVGEFDIVAVNLFAFGDQWRYGFALNDALPRSKSKKYTEADQKYLIATAPAISWPLERPFASDPLPLLDEIVRRRRRA